jgi:DNA processing protein
MSSDTNRDARIIWSRLAEPGDAVADALVASLGAHEALAVVMTRDQDKAVAVLTASPLNMSEHRASGMVDAAFDRFHQRFDAVDGDLLDGIPDSIRVVVPGDAEWPARLDDLGAVAPFALYVKGDGDLAALTQRSVTITGARASTAYGDVVTADLVTGLVDHHFTVVAGMAFGIDAAAHRAALASSEGRTVAVVAGGLDKPYPVAHDMLSTRISQDGVVVSEAFPGTPVSRWRFLERNRILAALTRATVIVEAGYRSGALSVATRADATGRPLGAVPGPVTSATSAGCHRILRELKSSVVVTEVSDIVELVGE